MLAMSATDPISAHFPEVRWLSGPSLQSRFEKSSRNGELARVIPCGGLPAGALSFLLSIPNAIKALLVYKMAFNMYRRALHVNAFFPSPTPWTAGSARGHCHRGLGCAEGRGQPGAGGDGGGEGRQDEPAEPRCVACYVAFNQNFCAWCGKSGVAYRSAG